MSVHAEKIYGPQIREREVGFAARWFRKRGALTKQDECGEDAGESAPARRKETALHMPSSARSIGGNLRNDERQRAHGKKKTHPGANRHTTSTKFGLDCPRSVSQARAQELYHA